MSNSIIIGSDNRDTSVPIDIEELLATRLLVQGNSGSGKSHLLRRLLEESAGLVQQVVIDPEGDFVTLAEPFGHVVIDGADYGDTEIVQLAARIRRHRASVVLALDGLEVEAQMRCAAMFLNALFDAPREEWYPALVVVDEAQMFAPAQGGDVSDEARRLSLSAMTNLMCRGRKRGLAGVIATQRLAKLAKNVAAEASNFLMGRTFLDIDMVRAADLLGMERRQAEQIRDLDRGMFLGLGPAISRRPVSVRIGSVRTGTRGAAPGLLPLPTASAEEMEALLHAAPETTEPPPPAPPRPSPGEQADALMERIAIQDAPAPDTTGDQADDTPDAAPIIAEVLREMAAEPDSAFQTSAALFQDFTLRCRARRAPLHGLDMTQFNRRFAMAQAGIDTDNDDHAALVALSQSVPDDMLAPFLAIARAAQDEAPCPDDDTLARIYGTSSAGRIRRLLDNFERMELLVIRTDFSGRRTVTVPRLGLTTAAV
ncbi:helicase HerA domain-containing protein [Croceicoccus hydrothermalis]|uniref:helicase HerA domain-containing protein n=1 Tax=Croceicoccus hydrothermalis TaxID=2867964 RepID=UPI001EFC0A0B